MKEINSKNWLTPSNNRYSFQNVASLFPSIVLGKGNDQSSVLRKNLQPIKTIEFDDLDGKKTIEEMLNTTFTDAFIVLKNDEIIFEEYLNNMGPESLHLMNSITKSFVGMLAGILAESNELDPNKKVSFYIPEFTNTAFAETTLQNALDMSAAVKFTEDYNDLLADFWYEAAVVGWRPDLLKKETPENLFQFALSLKETDQRDGERYYYQTVLTNVIAMAIERATGKRFQDLLEKFLWQKLGPEQDAVIVSDKTGFPYVGAGMSACARDLARFGLMLMHDGYYNEKQIVPASWIKSTRKGDDGYKKRFSDSDYSLLFPNGHYKNQVWVTDSDTMLCLGIYGQTIYINQRTGIVVVKFSSHPNPANNDLYVSSLLGIEAISSAI